MCNPRSTCMLLSVCALSLSLALAGCNLDLSFLQDIGVFGNVVGLTFNDNDNRIYGTETSTDQLLRIDPETGSAVPVGPTGFPRVESLAFDAMNNTLFGVSSSSFFSGGIFRTISTLIAIDPATGVGTAVGEVGLGPVTGLAFDSTSRTLFGVITDFTSVTTLIRIDLLTGAGTEVGPVGPMVIESLSFNPNTHKLFGADAVSGESISIDPLTGSGIVVGQIMVSNVQGLAFDPNANTLFGADTMSGFDELITVDPATGSTDVVGTMSGFDRVSGLTVDANTNTMFGTTGNQLFVVDAMSGEITAVGQLGFSDVKFLAFDTPMNILFGVDLDTDQEI